MTSSTNNELTAGDIVKLREPVSAEEAAARFDVVELRGDRVLIRLQCDMRIPPMEAVLVSDVERC